ncbi:MAG: hypothetical protein ABIJ56_19685, partial [Pseudomonadota bacterium]
MNSLKLNDFSVWILTSLFVIFASGCGDASIADDGAVDMDGVDRVDGTDTQTDAGPDAVPDNPPDLAPDAPDGTDGPDSPDTLPDPPPDSTDVVEEEGPPPECEYDDVTEHGSYCYGIRVDVAASIPGGVPRARYYFDVTRPEGEYDERCAYLDSVIVHGDSGEVRTGEARYSLRERGFVLEGEAASGETTACTDNNRIEVFGIEFTGRTPAGKFSGSCNMGPGWKWPPEVTLACHSGLETSLVADTMEYGPPATSEVYVYGMFGNHGPEALTGFTVTSTTWHNLEWMSDAFMLVEPPWWFLDIWSSDPAWEDRVDAGTWHAVNFSWSAMEAPFPESECP